jgi:hypothetical protein
VFWSQNLKLCLFLQKIGTKKANLLTVLDDLRVWYDGYLFNHNVKIPTYNPDMVLYFAQTYQTYKTYPNNLLDNNIASDYGKIRNIFRSNSRF